MHDQPKLPVEIWALKRDGRTRIMVQVQGDQVMELLSWPDGLEKLGLTSDPVVIPLSDAQEIKR